MSSTKRLTPSQENQYGTAIQAGLAAEKRLGDPNLTAQQRADLMEEVTAGRRALDALVEGSLPLVRYRAMSKEWPMRLPHLLEDIEAAGRVGLVSAALGFIPGANGFSAYAKTWIDRAMTRAANEMAPVLSAPLRDREAHCRLRAAEAALGSAATVTAIAEAAGLKADDDVVVYRDRMIAGRASLEVVSDASVAAETIVESDDRLAPLLGLLTRRQAEVIERRFGINGFPEMTQDEVAADLGVKQSCVSQHETAAMKRLRDAAEHAEFPVAIAA